MQRRLRNSRRSHEGPLELTNLRHAQEDDAQSCVTVSGVPMLGSRRSQVGLAEELLRDHGKSGTPTLRASQAPNGNTRPASFTSFARGNAAPHECRLRPEEGNHHAEYQWL